MFRVRIPVKPGIRASLVTPEPGVFQARGVNRRLAEIFADLGGRLTLGYSSTVLPPRAFPPSVSSMYSSSISRCPASVSRTIASFFSIFFSSLG